MADNGAPQSTSPQAVTLPVFYFKVTISNVGDIACSEVSGLDTEYEEISYHAGESPVRPQLKMPGLRKTCDLTLKKGITWNDKALCDWINKVNQHIIRREVVTVSLLDESGYPVKTWEALNAWPKRLTLSNLKADRNTTFVETLVIAHEGVGMK